MCRGVASEVAAILKNFILSVFASIAQALVAQETESG